MRRLLTGATFVALLSGAASAEAFKVGDLGEMPSRSVCIATAAAVLEAYIDEFGGRSTSGQTEGWEIYAGNVPSRGVSGDYYQMVERLDGRELVIMLADVSSYFLSPTSAGDSAVNTLPQRLQRSFSSSQSVAETDGLDIPLTDPLADQK